MGIQKQDIWPMAKQTVSEFFEHKAQTLAAALAVYTMLSIAPLLVIVTKVAGVMYKDAPHEVSEAMTGVIPGMEPKDIEGMITEAGKPGEGVLATVISTILVIFGATGVFGQLQDSMNTIWEVKPKPNQGVWGFIRTRFLSLAMVLGIAFLFMVSTVGTTLVTTVGESIAGKDNKVIAWILAHTVSLVVMWSLFTLMFKVLPDAKTAWKDCMMGAVITAVLFEAGKIGLAMYLEGSATKVFGAAGSLAALLLFIYYSAQIMFLGAEFTRVYAEKYGAGLAPQPHAVKVTEEDKAKQGRPSQERLEGKTAEDEGRAPAGRGAAPRPARPQRVASPAIPGYAMSWGGAPNGHNGGWRQYALAGAGVVAGALAGGLGAMAMAKDTKRPAKKHAAAIGLDARVRTVEGRIGKLSRIQQLLENESIYQRISEVEKRVRHARTTLRAEESHRPGWLIRLGDFVAGNKN